MPPFLVDSHCHLDRLDLTPFDGHMETALDRAREAGVGHMLCVAINLESFPAIRSLADAHGDISVSVGVHPSEREGREPAAQELAALARDPGVVAIGETGLDYHYNTGDLEWQRERFRRHIAAAKAVSKPLIIHSRDAPADTLRLLREEGADTVGGVMHCFTEDWAMAQAAMELNFYISFSGIVTFKNATALREVASRTPLERLLVETDSPYLAPVPFRGKSNQPAYVRRVAEHIASLRGLGLDALAAQTTENFFRLFRAARAA